MSLALANLVTYDGALPQGAPTSPILSNLLCRKLDSRLFKWARKEGYTYSRYADDLTFSTNRDSFPKGDRAFIKEIIREEGFEVHSGKERLMPDHTRQMVTGLVVNEKVNVPREYVRGLRALLHNVESHGWKSQVERQEWLFDDAEQWRRYRSQDLSAEEYEDLQEKQRKERAIVNPNALMPEIQAMINRAQSSDSEQKIRKTYRQAIEIFKQKVRGRIEYVGCVKGKKGDDGKTYRRLRRRYEELCHEDDQVVTRYNDRKQEVLENDPVYKKLEGEYRSFKDRIQKLEKPDLVEEMEEMSNQVIEFAWIRQDQKVENLRKTILKTAYPALSNHPKATGRFLSHFNRKDGCFRGLLHSPDVAEQDNVDDLLTEASTLFEVYRNYIPNALRDSVEDFLQECRKEFRESSGYWHPWTDEEFLDEKVLPFKEKTRFDDDGEATDLLGHLENKAENVKNEYGLSEGTNIDLPIVTERIFTHAITVKKGVGRLLESMMTNSKNESPTIKIEIHNQSENTGSNGTDLYAVVVEIFEEGGKIRKGPRLETLFSGKLQKALGYLRGYADWKFSAPFSDKGSYKFDVMKNERTEVPEPLSKIRHELTFYQ
jgi:hypothetical protein